MITATFPEVTAASLLPERAPESPAERLALVVDALTRQILQHEPELRAQLRLSLEPDPHERRELPFRTGKAVHWLEEALSPLRSQLPRRELRRLVLAIRSAVGIEAATLMRWSAHALLRAALAERETAD